MRLVIQREVYGSRSGPGPVPAPRGRVRAKADLVPGGRTLSRETFAPAGAPGDEEEGLDECRDIAIQTLYDPHS